MMSLRPFVFAALLMLSPFAVQAEGKLVLSSGMHEPWTNTAGTGFHSLFITELFKRLGRDAEVVFNPAAARALQLAEDGVDDGLAARMAGLEANYPNLIRVPEPFFSNDFVAASIKPVEGIRAWSDLPPHSVGYILGWQVFQNKVPPVRELTLAKDSKQLFGLLKAGRVEVILHERYQALWQAREQGISLTVYDPPLQPTPMYIYLHRRHADLVPRVAAELAAMKAEGRSEALMKRAFARLGQAR